MNKTVTVCVDMDDTIENLLSAWITCLNNNYGTSVSYKDITEWEMKKIFPTLTENEIFSPLKDMGLWEKVSPKKDAQMYLKKLIDEGYNVYICTASHYDTVALKMTQVLKQHFPYIDWRKIIVAHDKQMIRCDVMIDDYIGNLLGGSYMKILMDAPYNRGFDKDGIFRVHDWKEIYALIHKYYPIN